MDKTLGIIGGMGPLATVKLFEMIVLMTNANSDQEHIRILIDNNTSIPDRTNYILNKVGEDPRVQLTKSALALEKMGANYLVMPCNTAHHFYDDILEKINIPFINMIDETAKHIKDNYEDINKIGLLATEGTIQAKVYDSIFNKYEIEVIKPSPENQYYVTELIYNIKEGIQQDSLDGMYKAMDDLRDQGVDVFIAGCTEISVAMDLYKLEGNIVDALKVLATSAIKFADKEPKIEELGYKS
ncbi:MAG: amino acid racemase [Tissierellaceae bacterium]|nr:amino acid racemase [Tissierellaceae bacterium]